VFQEGCLNVTASVQASGDPEHDMERPVLAPGPVKFMAEDGQDDTVTVSLTETALQAFAETVLIVCVGEVKRGALDVVPLALEKVLAYRLVPLS